MIWKIWKSDALWHSDFILYRYCLHLFHSNTDLAGIVFSDWGSSVLSLAHVDYEKIFGKEKQINYFREKNQKPAGKKEGISLAWGILNERGLSGTRPLFFTDNGEYKMQKGR